jgi:hypothetical protein
MQIIADYHTITRRGGLIMAGKLKNVQSSPIVKDRDNDRDWRREKAAVLSGFLGAPLLGDDDKPLPGRDVDRVPKWRLYRTLAMDEYIEFNEEDVLHIVNESRAGQDAPRVDERVLVWLRSSATVTPVRDFLAGEIADSYMPEADFLAGLVDIVPGNVRFIKRAGGTEAPPCKG